MPIPKRSLRAAARGLTRRKRQRPRSESKSYSWSPETHRRVARLARTLGIKRSPMTEAWVKLGLDASEGLVKPVRMGAGKRRGRG